MRKTILLSSLFLSISCCCFSQNFLESFIYSTTINTPVTANEFLISMYGYPNPLFSELNNFQGVKTEFPGFFNYYTYYESSKDFVIDMINAMPSQELEYVDVEEKCKLLTNPPNSEVFFPTVDDLSSVEFWKPEEVIEKEYYSCFKFPWRHTILFDKTSSAVYYVVNEVWE